MAQYLQRVVVNDVIRYIIDENENPKIILVGHSAGGWWTRGGHVPPLAMEPCSRNACANAR
jgi:esterase/lipase superfamily enzyme